MKKINFVKFALDLAMGVVFALLFNRRVLGGMSFHEIAGLAVGGAVLTHILLNFRWVRNVTLALFSKKTALKAKIGYILNLLLLLDLAVILISGISISKVLFAGMAGQAGWFGQATHVAAAYIALALIGLHIGLHWQWVMNVCRKIFHIQKSAAVIRYALRGAAALVLAFGLYSMGTSSYFQRASELFAGSAYALEYRNSAGQGANSENPAADSGAQPNANAVGGALHAGGGENAQVQGGISANPADVIATYGSIMAAVAVCCYYAQKLLLLTKTRPARAKSPSAG